MDPVKSSHACYMNKPGPMHRRVLQETGILDYRQSFVPSTNLFHDPAAVQQGGWWTPKTCERCDLRVGVNRFHGSGDNVTGLELASFFDQSLPIRIGYIGVASPERLHAMRKSIRNQAVICIDVLYEFATC